MDFLRKNNTKNQHRNILPFQKHVWKKKKKNVVLASSFTWDNLRIQSNQSPATTTAPCLDKALVFLASFHGTL